MDRRPGERSEPDGAGRVIGMVVSEHDRPDAGGSPADLLEMTLVVRSGVDDDRRGIAHHVRVGSFELTNPRIRRKHTGDAEHRISPARRPTEAGARARPRRALAWRCGARAVPRRWRTPKWRPPCSTWASRA